MIQIQTEQIKLAKLKRNIGIVSICILFIGMAALIVSRIMSLVLSIIGVIGLIYSLNIKVEDKKE